MAPGKVPLNDLLVAFRDNLSFHFTNIADLSEGKDLHCECITYVQNHLFLNEVALLGLGSFTHVLKHSCLLEVCALTQVI